MRLNSNKNRVRQEDKQGQPCPPTRVPSYQHTARTGLPKYDAYLKLVKDEYEETVKNDPDAAKKDPRKGQSAGVLHGVDYHTRKSTYEQTVQRIVNSKVALQLGPFPDLPQDRIPRGRPPASLRDDDSDSDFENFV